MKPKAPKSPSENAVQQSTICAANGHAKRSITEQAIANEQGVTSCKPTVSFFAKGIRQTKPTRKYSLEAVALRIKRSLKEETTHLRSLPSDSGAQRKYKLTLPYVTPAGTFSNRANSGLLTRSGWIVLDFDKLNSPRKLRRRLLADKKLRDSIVLAYISPRRYGLKVWIAVDPSLDYKACYAAVVAHVKAKYPSWCKDGKLDVTADVSRGCLLCHDPEVYFNEDYATAPAFPMSVESLADLFDESRNPTYFTELRTANTETVDRWVQVAEQAPDFADNYHIWFRLGIAFTTMGEEGCSFFHRVSKTSAKYNEAECDKNFDYWSKHNNGRLTLGTFFFLCRQAGAVPEGANQIPDEIFAGTPCFKASTFQLLPSLLQEVCQHFASERKRDISFMGLVGVLLGCFPTLQGRYGGKTIRANQYVFVTGNAATGKSAMEVGRELLWPHHEARRAAQKEYDAAYKLYERQLRAYEQAELAGKKPAAPPVAPVAPIWSRVFGGSDNNLPTIVKMLAENNECLIIFDTEADTVSNGFKQDHGDPSPLLRKASEHEPYLYERKTVGSYELSHPALALVVSGTPQQVQPLIQSVENGLFSRFWFYAYFLPHTFDDPFADEESELEQCLQRLSKQVGDMVEWVAQYDVTVKLTSDQQQRFNAIWDGWVTDGVANFGQGSGSIMKRQARACFRLCMLLTLLRNYEVGQPLASTLVCSEDDFTAALEIADVLRQHALIVYQQLAPRTRQFKKAEGNKKKATQDERIAELFQQGLGPRPIGKRLEMPHTTVAGRLAAMGLKR
jgi:hypothetical protein